MIIDSPIISGSLIVTGSAAFTGSLTLSGSMTTVGTITATTLVVQTVTSSISRITGSTSFGSSSINNHNFTGSLIVSGAMFVSSSGNIGIGTNSPAIYSGWVGLDVRGGNGGHIIVANTGSTNRGEIVTDGNGFNITAVTNNAMLFKTNDTERMRITSAGNIQIDSGQLNTPKSLYFQCNSSAGGNLGSIDWYNVQWDGFIRAQIKAETDTGLSNGRLVFSTGGGGVTERMRITSTGNVSIGTTNTTARFNIQASANFETSTLGTATGTMGYLSANGLYGMYVGIGNSGNTWLQSQRNDGNTATYSLLLNPQGGNVGVGTSSPGSLLHIEASSVSYGFFRILNTAGSGESSINMGRTGQTLEQRWTFGQGTAGVGDTFGFYTGGSNKATLTTSGVWSTTGGGTSDRRTKQDIDYNFDSGIESILKLQPIKFKFKSSPDNQRRGFIAQDVLETIPDLVLGDGEKEDGTYGLDYDGILALAVKAIQELNTKLDAANAEIALLKAK